MPATGPGRAGSPLSSGPRIPLLTPQPACSALTSLAQSEVLVFSTSHHLEGHKASLLAKSYFRASLHLDGPASASPCLETSLGSLLSEPPGLHNVRAPADFLGAVTLAETEPAPLGKEKMVICVLVSQGCVANDPQQSAGNNKNTVLCSEVQTQVHKRAEVQGRSGNVFVLEAPGGPAFLPCSRRPPTVHGLWPLSVLADSSQTLLTRTCSDHPAPLLHLRALNLITPASSFLP